MDEQLILTERRDRIGILTINRPNTLNALNTPTLLALEAAFGDLETDDRIHVIVLTGAGDKAFVAGGDIAEMDGRQGIAHYQAFAEDIHRVLRSIEACDKPTICAVNGWALGGGTELVLATDLRIAAESARFGVPEIGLGLFPGAGGSQRLIRQIGLCRAKELMFTGDPVDAAEAVRLGLVNRAVPKERLMEKTLELAGKIAGKSPLVLKLLKRNLRAGADMPLNAALAHEQAMISLVFDTRDAHEGMGAFVEKRAAKFTGR